MAGYTNHPDYEALPESIKAVYTQKDFAWLGERGREWLMEVECYPEPDEEVEE